MRYQKLLILLFFLPVSLLGQRTIPDTLPLSDTLSYNLSLLKSAGDFTIETTADTAITLVFNELLARNSAFIFDGFGDDDDWFEIYNYGDDPVKLNTLYFTDDPSIPLMWKLDTLEDLFLDPREHFLIWADGEPAEGFNHAPFKLDGEGETLAIYTEEGTLIDYVSYGPQSTNISYGRYPDAGLNWNFFPDPTPGAENAEPGSGNILPAPYSNLTGGVYSEPVILALYADIPGASIFYTRDCTEPDNSDLQYQQPLEISSTTIVRARLAKEGSLSGPVLTISVIMDETAYENPVISLVAEPEAFYGSSGLISANNRYIEVPASFEYMEEGNALFQGGTGIQLHAPKATMPNSLRLYSRSRYGNNWFDHKFFNENGPEKYKRLILRNSGNDNVNKNVTNTHFRDPLIQTIAKKSNRNPMLSESRPVNVFLNGNYHGLFNMRERIDQYYIETHRGITENYDLLEKAFGFPSNMNAIVGSFDAWKSLLAFVDTTGDLSLETDFLTVQEHVDLENFTDYWITEVFTGNYDWLSNNVKLWKSENGKWQWIYWDTDHGLGLKYSSYGEVEWNTLVWSLTYSDRAWSSGYHNILIRNLMKNAGYREYFIKRFTQLLSTSFRFDQTFTLLDSMHILYEKDMAVHTQHWGKSMNNWERACDIVEDYLRRRPDSVYNHLRDYFGLQDPVHVSIRAEPPGAGILSFSGLEVSSTPVEGKFFPGMNYQLQQESVPGFTLDKWEPFDNPSDFIEFQLTDSMEIVAYFLPTDHTFPIQLAEVYFNNLGNYDAGDWLEFYYYGSDSVNISGWHLTGNNDQLLYTFKENTILQPGEMFLICENLTQFEAIFPSKVRCFGNMNRGFSGQSTLTLKSAEGESKKAVDLMNSTEWPQLPGEGYSIELISLATDSGDGNNWGLSVNRFGSPGLLNHSFYNFQKPAGRDTVFTNSTTHLIAFSSSQDFYSDPDNHSLAAIVVKDITGPGQININETVVEKGNAYDPADFIFQPREPRSTKTTLTYSFIDKSGEESADYTIQFSPSVGVSRISQHPFRLYPVPARDFCIIEIPPDHIGPLDFYLIDINGKTLQAKHSASGDKSLLIDLSAMESGIYFYLIRTAKTVVNGKIEVLK